MKLSPDFWLHEFTFSQRAARLGVALEPPDEVIENLGRLCRTVLQPARAKLGLPVVITSGWRPKWLNESVGGSENSAHLYGCAADIIIAGMSPQGFTMWLRTLDLPVDQVILEHGRWTHVAIAGPGKKPRNQYLTAAMANGRTVYQPLDFVA